MKKNGFIATSILYSFFLVFITLFVILISNYLRNQTLLNSINEDAHNKIQKINNIKFSDLKVGDYVKFSVNPNGNNGKPVLNGDAKWILYDIQETTTQTPTTNGSSKNTTQAVAKKKKVYYFLSDLDAQLIDISLNVKGSPFSMHAMSIDIYSELVTQGTYTSSILFPNVEVTIPTISILQKLRDSNDLSDVIKKAIFNVDGSYIVYADKRIGDYIPDQYYYYRMYNFTSNHENIQNNANLEKLLTNYCNVTYNNQKLSYNSANPFGYTDIETDEINKTPYISRCYYASPSEYEHSASDNIVEFDEKNPNDIITNMAASSYTFRLNAKVEIEEDYENQYIYGGKGTSIEPYLITNGVKP